MLDDPGFAPAALVADLARQTRDRIAAEMELLTRLQRIGAAEPADWEDVLQVVALLQGLGSESAGRRQRAALSAVDEVPLPVAALAEAVLSESDPNVAGALRWALARTGDGGLALLAQGLGSPVAEVHERAVRSIAEVPTDAATALLHDALGSADIVVRRYAALALGTRRGTDAIPTLLDMIVEGANDADAADALSAPAARQAAGSLANTGSPAGRRLASRHRQPGGPRAPSGHPQAARPKRRWQSRGRTPLADTPGRPQPDTLRGRHAPSRQPPRAARPTTAPPATVVPCRPRLNDSPMRRATTAADAASRNPPPHRADTRLPPRTAPPLPTDTSRRGTGP
ncbi:HEAT repeat domain-containing protein [Asanoa sp. NPDC049573]|uniref:HEAT repeat domain-containing protein n=1 Tax=Asanoa sp. NPDC049573 TaxID=3155396 RepID=UPI00341B49D1